MPSATEEFRVGDRVETRRGENIPEEFRRLRAEVVRVLRSGLIEVRFVNPPMVDGNPVHYHPEDRWWRSEELRLVERTLRLGVGATVVVSDPAYTRANGHGGVQSKYYGQTCEVIAPPDSGSETWRVSHPVDTGEYNYVHPNYLTVIEEAPPQRFNTGDVVRVSPRAYRTARPSIGNEQLAAAGKIGILSYRGLGKAWDVTILGRGRAYSIHENWLTPYVDEAEPCFSAGQVVTIGPAPSGFAGGESPLPSGWEGQTVLVMRQDPQIPTRLVVRSPDSGSEVTIHQKDLTLTEIPTPELGATVRVKRGAVTPGSLRLSPVAAGYHLRVGTVEAVNDSGDIAVNLPNGRVAVHPSGLIVYTAEEAAALLSVGDIVRVSTDAHATAPSRMLGRRVRCVAEHPVEQLWTVTHDGTGDSAAVPERFLTKVNAVSTVETGFIRCRSCAEAVPSDEAMGPYCTQCVATCHHCERALRLDATERPIIWSEWEGEWVWQCADCVAPCRSCTQMRRRAEMRRHRGHRYCPGCLGVCTADDCDEVVIGRGECSDCANDGGGLGSWRRTTPTMWLGGPVRRQGGYYIGFEHEIKARDGFRLKPLRRWAAEHLGDSRALDPKPDSSVRGFEIATQPMTPLFFEGVDWDSYMQVINDAYPISGEEPEGHGLHVHIGRQAFRTEKIIRRDNYGRRLAKPRKVMVTDSGMLAAYTYLLSRGHAHLTRIGRRDSHWAVEVTQPVKATIIHPTSEVRGKQRDKISYGPRVNIPRGAVNLTNPKTIEIRVARSTRSAEELKAAVRVVYLAAEYVRHLRSEGSISPSKVNWTDFAAWVGEVMPEAHASIAGVTGRRARPVTAMSPTLFEAFNTEKAAEMKSTGALNLDMELEEAVLAAPDLSGVTTRAAEAAVRMREHFTGAALQRGSRVRISDPAYATPEADSVLGFVESRFYGQVGEIERQLTRRGMWSVRLVDGGPSTNEIHENWLSLEAEEVDEEAESEF